MDSASFSVYGGVHLLGLVLKMKSWKKCVDVSCLSWQLEIHTNRQMNSSCQKLKYKILKLNLWQYVQFWYKCTLLQDSSLLAAVLVLRQSNGLNGCHYWSASILGPRLTIYPLELMDTIRLWYILNCSSVPLYSDYCGEEQTVFTPSSRISMHVFL